MSIEHPVGYCDSPACIGYPLETDLVKIGEATVHEDCAERDAAEERAYWANAFTAGGRRGGKVERIDEILERVFDRADHDRKAARE